MNYEVAKVWMERLERQKQEAEMLLVEERCDSELQEIVLSSYRAAIWELRDYLVAVDVIGLAEYFGVDKISIVWVDPFEATVEATGGLQPGWWYFGEVLVANHYHNVDIYLAANTQDALMLPADYVKAKLLDAKDPSKSNV